jgi:hypothetical protein
MTVTAKLSKRLYEVLGEDVANELVNWFNQVDATYRADLRELNELNFGRFDAKLEQRLAQSDARWERRLAESDTKWDRRLADSDTKWDRRLAEFDAKWEGRLAEFDAKWERRLPEFDAKWVELRVEIHKTRADLVKWMFMFWAPTALGVLGTGVGVVSLLLRR